MRLPSLNPIDAAHALLRSTGEVTDRMLDRTVRLAVTGLSRSGKTVFTTCLVHNLLHASRTRLPFLEAAHAGRLIGARLRPHPDRDVAPFGYDTFIRSLTAPGPSWPPSTEGISQLRLALRFRPTGLLRRQVSALATIHLDIIDYPGEWLLDLPLLGQDFEAWSAVMLALCEAEPRRSLARDWLDHLAGLDLAGPAEEETLRRCAALYTAFLHRCKDARHGLSLLQPGRFTIPGELREAALLQFCPLPPESGRPAGRGSIRATMRERFESYKRHVVRPFYRDHFARFDRQIVLVDVLRALNTGYESFLDAGRAIGTVLESFDYRRPGLIGRLFRPAVDRVLFAATKADHVSANQHNNLRLLFDHMVGEASAVIRFEGAEVKAMPLASIKCTETVVTELQGQKLSCIKGRPVGRDEEMVLFPGEIPPAPPVPADWTEGRFRFLEFQPPRLADRGHSGVPHIAMDQALEFLLGDKLR